MTVHPVILAGGSGTRLWPLSREFYPKPFLNVVGEYSLLQDTLLRLQGIADLSRPTVVCNEEHRFLVGKHASEVGQIPETIILEPVAKNTAPALTLATLRLQETSTDSDPVLLVMPADHIVTNDYEFQAAVLRGIQLATEGCIVTFGIRPTKPETNYGYLRKGSAYPTGSQNDSSASESFILEQFVEKPNERMAEHLISTGGYLWNSGIFVLRASTWLEQLTKFRPDISIACQRAIQHGERDGLFYRPKIDEFRACPSDTIDYAVMERICSEESGLINSVVVPLEAGWSDVGNWSTWLDVQHRDQRGNVIRGDVFTHRANDSLLMAQHRLVAVTGLERIIVIETADAILIANADDVEGVKELVTQLRKHNRAEQENHRKVHRPWGWYETVDNGPGFQVKRITVNPGAALSLQEHRHRAEHWVVVRGIATITKGDQEFLLHENESTYVSMGERHRLGNSGEAVLEIIEIQSGDYLGEDDIVRFEDHYNR